MDRTLWLEAGGTLCDDKASGDRHGEPESLGWRRGGGGGEKVNDGEEERWRRMGIMYGYRDRRTGGMEMA